jgi:transcriptional regulator with XRE-family HTH domain
MAGPLIRKDGRFCKALKRAMRLAGMSQTDVAKDLGVSRATVYGWLTGSEPSDANFEKLVTIFPELAEFA